mmetsp:Transcript_10450/g.17774  ORF Transcript_10450/g.17774 Transcript_10450/m.17774 type:complete len:91 (-) Transcript_10450:281-553(-)
MQSSSILLGNQHYSLLGKDSHISQKPRLSLPRNNKCLYLDMACYHNTARRQDILNPILSDMGAYTARKPLGRKCHKRRNRLGRRAQQVLL